MMGYPLSLQLHSACSFHPPRHACRDSQQSLPVVTQPDQLAWGALSGHFLMECAQQWHWMLLSSAIWTVSAFFLWSFSLTVATKQDVSQTLKEKGQRVKFGFCRRKGEKKIVVPECACSEELLHGSGARLLAGCCAVSWWESAIPRDYIKQTLAALSTLFLSHLHFWSIPGHHMCPQQQPRLCHRWHFAMYWPSHQQTSAELAGFYPHWPNPSSHGAGHPSQGGVSFSSVTAGNQSY